jgi:hypothetical protein
MKQTSIEGKYSSSVAKSRSSCIYSAASLSLSEFRMKKAKKIATNRIYKKNHTLSELSRMKSIYLHWLDKKNR